jgi:hypothetical protein
MYALPLRPPRAPAAGALGLLLALLLCAGPVRAQQSPSREPSTQEYAREIQKQMKEVEDSNCTNRQIIRFFKSWVGLVLIALVVVPLVIAFKVAIWFASRMTATTDPEKLAMSDPWVRAHLARQKATGEGPAAEGP